jgi:hypothetical protein
LDLNRGCIHLGIARLAYAGLIVVAIASGLLLGLTLLGVSLPVAYSSRHFEFVAAAVAKERRQ